MSGVIVLLLSCKLLSSRSLSLGVEVLNLGLTEDTVANAVSICS